MPRFFSILLFVCSLTLLSACQPAAAPPTPITQSAAVRVNDTVIRWVRSPEEIIFQADVSGGSRDSTLIGRRDVPLCTLYGDNRLVWVNELGPFNIEVLYDRVEDNVIGDFLLWLTVNQRVYTYQTPADAQTGAVVESIVLNINGAHHSANGFSGWDQDWFSSVVQACRSLSQTPVLFQPTGAWLSVETAEYDSQAPTLVWNTPSIDLPSLAGGAPIWITGEPMLSLWTMQLTQPSRFLLTQANAYYAIALQVPGISRTSPPAPR